ncbi:MAG: CopD family protein [Thioalkalivibrionaceae bacterium]
MTLYLWLQALHLIFMVTWFAGLFYLPRLFVYHADTRDAAGHTRFCVMERKLFYGIMTPGAVLTVAFGVGMLALAPHWLAQPWMHVKLFLIAVLIGYHIWCGVLVARFARSANRHTHRWYRVFNELPVFALVGIVPMAIGKATQPGWIAMGVIALIFIAFVVIARARRRDTTA